MQPDVTEKQQQSSSPLAGSSSYTYWVREVTEDAAPLHVPRKLSAEDLSKQQSSALGSAWNQAGTWEEKNLSRWATNRIKELLTSLQCMEFSHGKADIHEVSKCVGDAFLVTVRNKKRVGYTFEMTLQFKGEWMIKDEKKEIEGYLDVPEFTFGELEDLKMEVRLSGDKDLAVDDKKGITDDVKSILPAIREQLLKFEEELKDR